MIELLYQIYEVLKTLHPYVSFILLIYNRRKAIYKLVKKIIKKGARDLPGKKARRVPFKKNETRL